MPDLRPTHRSLLNQPTPPFEGASAAIWPSHPRYGKRGPERAAGNRGRSRGPAQVDRRPHRRCPQACSGVDAEATACGPQRDDEAVPGHLFHPDARRVGERPVERGRRSVGRAARVRNFWGLYFIDPPPAPKAILPGRSLGSVTGSWRRPLSATLGGAVLAL